MKKMKGSQIAVMAAAAFLLIAMLVVTGLVRGALDDAMESRPGDQPAAQSGELTL